METRVTAGLFKLNFVDLAKGALVAAISAALVIVQTSVDAGSLAFDWKKIGTVAAIAGIGYLIKNFFTSQETITKV